jgi:hypothetical protein
MTQAEIRAFENAGRTTAVWSSESFDGTTHYGDVIRALIPASLILAIATGLLVALL